MAEVGVALQLKGFLDPITIQVQGITINLQLREIDGLRTRVAQLERINREFAAEDGRLRASLTAERNLLEAERRESRAVEAELQQKLRASDGVITTAQRLIGAEVVRQAQVNGF